MNKQRVLFILVGLGRPEDPLGPGGFQRSEGAASSRQ